MKARGAYVIPSGCYSAPRPGPRVQEKSAKQREARAGAPATKFLGEAGTSPFAEPAILKEVVLFFESRQARVWAPRAIDKACR